MEYRQKIGDKARPAFPSTFSLMTVVAALLLGGTIGKLGTSIGAYCIALVVMASIVLLRQDEIAVIIVMAVHLYIDWYLVFHLVALLLVMLLLFIFFLTRSPERLWLEPRALWLWVLLLILSIYPAIRGDLTQHDTLIYYPNVICGAFLMYWLGIIVGRTVTSMRKLFLLLSAFGTLIALHTIIQGTTGVFLFGSSLANAYLASVGNYQLSPSVNVSRLGSFFIDPDWNASFFASILLLTLGLFFDSSSLSKKVFFLFEIFLMLTALLLTYSAGAWIAVIEGIGFFVVLVGGVRHRIQIPLFALITSIVMLVGFPSQVNLLLQHASDPSELMLRTGAWQTALRVIEAFPLTGVGWGHTAYLLRSAPYRVPAQVVLLDHPHNSYLEIGAMAGLPVLIVFLALLAYTLWQALSNWRRNGLQARTLLGAGIASIIVLCINSWSIDIWTLPPLAALGWLILGVISSPLLVRSPNGEIPQDAVQMGVNSVSSRPA